MQSLHRVRDRLVGERTALINQLRAVLLERGIAVPQGRRQLEQLISVDQAVANLVQALKDKGILDDTYIIFSSDNGFMRGEHRISGGKFLPYDPSSRVPLIIRGPGIPAGGTSDEIVWNGDIPQTIRDIASGSADSTQRIKCSILQVQTSGTRRIAFVTTHALPTTFHQTIHCSHSMT